MQRYRETGTLIDNLTYVTSSTSNRLTSVTDAVAATTETWDAETGSFTYDPNGNLATSPAPYSITAVSYNYQNLPASLTRSGTTTTYRYDDAGERITKTVGTGNSEIYLRDGATTLGVFTLNTSGAVVSSYFNLIWEGRVIGRQPSTGSRSYYQFDILGSTRAVVQGATVVQSNDYDPWGLAMPGRALVGSTKEAFSGKEQDAETGLDYFGARYYMPAVGRWAAVDPALDGMPEWSSYNYAFDGPVLNTDPDGRQVGACIDPSQHDCETVSFEQQVVDAAKDGRVLAEQQALGAANKVSSFSAPFGLCAQVGNCVQGDNGIEDALDHVAARASRQPFGNPHAARIMADPRSSTAAKIGAFVEYGAGLPGALGGLGVVGEAEGGANALRQWHKATFKSEAESAAYHLEKHGAGQTLEQYTQDAADFFKGNSHRGTTMIANDGAEALKITTPGGGRGGIFTTLGKIITFWYK